MSDPLMDLDTFRTVLRTPPPCDPPDLAAIVASGRRIRRGRVVGRASLAVAASVLVVAGAVAIGRPSNPPETGDPPRPSSSAGVSPSPSSSPAPAPSGPVTTGMEPWGDVVDTGLRAGDNDVVLFVRALTVGAAVAPIVHIGRRDGAGGILPGTGVNDPDDPFGAGFHGYTTGELGAPDSPVAEFGYYVGPAARIVRQLAGDPDAVARQAPWSVNPDVVLFWFPTDEVARADTTSPLLSAYDAAGNPLPAGDGRITRG